MPHAQFGLYQQEFLENSRRKYDAWLYYHDSDTQTLLKCYGGDIRHTYNEDAYMTVTETPIRSRMSVAQRYQIRLHILLKRQTRLHWTTKPPDYRITKIPLRRQTTLIMQLLYD